MGYCDQDPRLRFQVQKSCITDEIDIKQVAICITMGIVIYSHGYIFECIGILMVLGLLVAQHEDFEMESDRSKTRSSENHIAVKSISNGWEENQTLEKSLSRVPVVSGDSRVIKKAESLGEKKPLDEKKPDSCLKLLEHRPDKAPMLEGSDVEDRAFLNALKAFVKETNMLWDKIAAVPGNRDIKMKVLEAVEAAKRLQVKREQVLRYRKDSNNNATPGKLPQWARKENLIPHMITQQYIDPDGIFAGTRTCNLNEVFDSNGSNRMEEFKRRDNSGEWLNDCCTFQEEVLYKLKMGYIN